MTTYSEFIETKNRFLSGHEYETKNGSICDGGILTERYYRDDGNQFFVDIESCIKDGLVYTTYEYWSTTLAKTYYAHTCHNRYRFARRA